MQSKYCLQECWYFLWRAVEETKWKYEIFDTLVGLNPGGSIRPNLAVPNLLTRGAMIPMEASKEETFWTNPIGTGAYKLVSWDVGVQVVLEANEDYWDGAPEIKTLVYDIIPDTTARTAAVKSGEYPDRDIEKAMELAKACGYNGEEIKIAYGGTYTGDSEQYYTQGCRNLGWTYDAAEELLGKIYGVGITAEQREEYLVGRTG